MVLPSGYLAVVALFGGCFAAVIAARADALPLTSLRSPVSGRYFATKCGTTRYLRILCRVAAGGCFATVLLDVRAREDTLPP